MKAEVINDLCKKASGKTAEIEKATIRLTKFSAQKDKPDTFNSQTIERYHSDLSAKLKEYTLLLDLIQTAQKATESADVCKEFGKTVNQVYSFETFKSYSRKAERALRIFPHAEPAHITASLISRDEDAPEQEPAGGLSRARQEKQAAEKFSTARQLSTVRKE